MGSRKTCVCGTILIVAGILLVVGAIWLYMHAPTVKLDCSSIRIAKVMHAEGFKEVKVVGCSVLLVDDDGNVKKIDVVHEYRLYMDVVTLMIIFGIILFFVGIVVIGM